MKNFILLISFIFTPGFLHAEATQLFSQDSFRLKSTFVGDALTNSIGVAITIDASDASGNLDEQKANEFLLTALMSGTDETRKNIAVAPNQSTADIICSVIAKQFIGAKCDIEIDSLIQTRTEKALIELPFHQVKTQRASGIRLNAMLAAPNMVSIKVGSQLSKDVRVIAIKNDLIILGSSNGDYQIVSFARGNRSGLFKQGL